VSETGRDDGSTPDPVDWGTARRVAVLVAGRDPLGESYLAASLRSDFGAVTAEAEDLVADFTGLRAPGIANAAVLDRSEWVDANLVSMRRMFAPLMSRLGERLARSPMGPLGRHVGASELGALLGYMARRVLGQYDLLVPDDGVAGGGQRSPAERDAVYYVGPNVLALEKRFAFRPRDFRTWIALHEVTHRAQFTGVPWMREHFLGLVRKSLELMDPDPRSLVRALRRAVEHLSAGRNPLDDGGLFGLFASSEQRALLSEVQALMSLLEGHGNYVMSELGRRHVHGEPRMARVLQARRNRGGLSGQVHKALGLELKLRQYDTGENFVRAVVDAAGADVLDAVWSSPSALPTLGELDDPDRWLTRRAATSATSVAR